MRLLSLSDALFPPRRSRHEEPPCTSINKSCGRCFYSACSRRQGPTDNASMDGSPYRKSPRDLLREYCWPNLSTGALPMGRAVTFLQSVHRARQSPPTMKEPSSFPDSSSAVQNQSPPTPHGHTFLSMNMNARNMSPHCSNELPMFSYVVTYGQMRRASITPPSYRGSSKLGGVIEGQLP